MKKSILLRSCAAIAMPLSAASLFPAAAMAQSTGSTEIEEGTTIVVTGQRERDVGGFEAPDTPKAKAVVDQEYIARNQPGQTVLDIINVVPGVSFQNNDAYGNSGGKLTIRGFDQTRVSYTLDGIQLNDSGNYEVYSNFSIDPEILEQVNVGLGSTDVDSPTASATGGTVNQRTRIPGMNFGGRFVGTLGESDYSRGFMMVDTGALTASGLRAFVSASKTDYDNPFNNYGKVKRQQYNARVYQPFGDNGDFVSLAGRYNRDRNNFFGSVTLRNDAEVPGGFPQDQVDREYEIDADCTLDTPQAGVADLPNLCGVEFDRRLNPSNSWNVRANSRFTLAENIILTVDPSFQYTKANGGGVTTNTSGSGSAREGFISGEGATTGFINGGYYFGRDLNGDGDTLDRVTLSNPSQTITNRYGVIAGLRWDATPDHIFRVTYTRDHADHQQTGEIGFLQDNARPFEAFPIDDPIADVDGDIVQKRNRQSYAILDQVAGEWRGTFGPLLLNVGVRAPFFTRDLENFCYTTSANGFVDCIAAEDRDAYEDANPYTVDEETGIPTGSARPDHRILKYNKLLPNLGAVYDFTPQISGFVSFAKGLSVPSTDNLYNAFFFPEDTPQARPNPETTDTFDGGFRYRSSRIQAQLGGWFTKFDNRLASAYDPELDRTVYRNLGRVNKWGIDASIAYQPLDDLFVYGFGSLIESEIKDNLVIGGTLPDGETCDTVDPDTAIALRNCAFTAGKAESGAPGYMYGASALWTFGPFDFGVTAKRTGSRYVYDTNVATFSGDVDNLGGDPANDPTVIYGAKAPAYWLVNLDARFNLNKVGLNTRGNTYLQLNVYNLFDELFVGNFGGSLNQGVSASSGFYSGPGFVQIGAPRTMSLSLNVGF